MKHIETTYCWKCNEQLESWILVMHGRLRHHKGVENENAITTQVYEIPHGARLN